MRTSVRIALIGTTALTLVGCTGSTLPRTGILTVTVAGLPQGALPAIALVGPDSTRRVITATQTLTQLPPGAYVLTSADVSANEIYRANLPTQNVTIQPSRAAIGLRVDYTAITGTLRLAGEGLPSGLVPVFNITGPENYSRTVSGPQSISRLSPGEYTVVVPAVSAPSDRYTAQNSPLKPTVIAGNSTIATATYILAPATLNLQIDGAYLTQSSQRYAGSVPLVTGRAAYLRIFPRANEPNGATPSVRIRLYNNGQLLSTSSAAGRGAGVPTTVDEGSVAASWSVPVDGSLIQPGFSFAVDVDPDNLLRETNDSDNSFPKSGVPVALSVVTAALLNIRFVPIVTSVNGLVGNVSEANENALLDLTLRIYPLNTFSVDVHSPFTTGANLSDSATELAAWSQILNELDVVRIAEGSGRYYAGILKSPAGLKYAGFGYIGRPTSVSYDVASDAPRVVAHELGHNWGRLHAPCGSPANVDSKYPYAGASIGTFGLDLATGQIKAPSATSDLMSYCNPSWISDYTYSGVMSYRSAQFATAPESARQLCLVVWGRTDRNGLILEPAFLTETQPRLPVRRGPYHLDGYYQLNRLFSLDFAPDSVGDMPSDIGTFAFAIPVNVSTGQITKLRLTGGGQQVERQVAAEEGPTAIDAAVQVSDAAMAGSSIISWNSQLFPLIVVHDTESGEILALGRAGRVRVSGKPSRLRVTLSNGVRSISAPPFRPRQ